MKIGFIGLGLMGNPMAKNIHQAGLSQGLSEKDNSAILQVLKSNFKR